MVWPTVSALVGLGAPARLEVAIDADQGHLFHPRRRWRGEIETLHVSTPRGLKPRPSTSPTHPGVGALSTESVAVRL